VLDDGRVAVGGPAGSIEVRCRPILKAVDSRAECRCRLYILYVLFVARTPSLFLDVWPCLQSVTLYCAKCLPLVN
jgi:hypothetical protein